MAFKLPTLQYDSFSHI